MGTDLDLIGIMGEHFTSPTLRHPDSRIDKCLRRRLGRADGTRPLGRGLVARNVGRGPLLQSLDLASTAPTGIRRADAGRTGTNLLTDDIGFASGLCS
jgi:hypothetical protein